MISLARRGFAIVGCASHHWEFLTDAARNTKDLELMGVFDWNEVRGKKVADKCGTRYFHDLDEMLSTSGLEIGVVTGENAKKKDLALAVAKSGKHVICDKPLGVTAEESRQIIKQCESSRVILQVGYVSRYTNQARIMKEYLSKNKVGKIKFIQGENRVDMGLVKMLSPWLLKKELAGGGAMLEHSVHAMDLALWYNERAEPLTAYAIAGRNLDPSCEGEDNFVYMIKFDDGSFATVDGSYCRASSGKSGDVTMKIFGDKSSAQLIISNLELRECLGEEPDSQVKFHSRGIGSADEGNSGELMVKDMLNSIRSRKDPLSNGRSAEKVNRVVDACYRSLASGKEIVIERNRR